MNKFYMTMFIFLLSPLVFLKPGLFIGWNIWEALCVLIVYIIAIGLVVSKALDE